MMGWTAQALNAPEIAGLLTAITLLLTALGGGVAWLVDTVRQVRADMIEHGRQLASVSNEMRNNGGSTVKDGIDRTAQTVGQSAGILIEVVAQLERVERAQSAMVAQVGRVEQAQSAMVAQIEDLAHRVDTHRDDAERSVVALRGEVDRLTVAADREHRSLWQRIGDVLGTAGELGD